MGGCWGTLICASRQGAPREQELEVSHVLAQLVELHLGLVFHPLSLLQSLGKAFS